MKTLIARHKAGEHIGICSVCSAHPLVIEAALAFDRNSTRKVLIEATSNGISLPGQVNQFGGYTGMTPADFREFVFAIADKVGFARERIILGGDHLGPNCWQQENADAAMEKSVELVKAYVRAGFSKIHLDASMSCADDSIPLAPETVAERAAVLCLAAESVATDCQREQLNYVIGTEVPVPGGEASAIQSVHITQVEDAANTLRTHQKAFIARGLAEALTRPFWSNHASNKRVIAIVVQPGVEFDHSNIIHYQAQEAQALAQWIEKTKMVYEAHSTDYQTQAAYRELVRDHFAILKVGPALTFALREAIFALAQIEQELIAPENSSGCLAVIEEVMLDEPQYWKKYYRTGFNDSLLDIRYSLSDRIRYYWPHSRIKNSVETMMVNLEGVDIPLGMISLSRVSSETI
ncbi:D-tagatose-1,6-bisphosphate aldolase subunit GatZ [Escherichia coli]|uniref:D-tagatose-1,6-bisphosphate aldolase subunit GatZ n=1 Tax=Escherichia coli TaxID=562 RepID=A0A8S0FS77_ECOLX|nr:D-tagatose-1,6-bisphosphate aldolase subunit GatZ [Escherichia coli]